MSTIAMRSVPAVLVPARACSCLCAWSPAAPLAFLKGLAAVHAAERFAFHGDLALLAGNEAFAVMLAPLRHADWVVYKSGSRMTQGNTESLRAGKEL